MINLRYQKLKLVVALASLWTVSGIGLAQEKSTANVKATRPVVVLATSKIDQMLPQISYLMRAINQPELGGTVSLMFNQYARGIDRSRPIGMTASLNSFGNPDAALILPITELKDLFANLAAIGEPEDLGGGLYTMDVASRPIFLKQIDKWLVVAQQEDVAQAIQSIPEELFSKLSSQYAIGMRLDIQSIPPDLRDSLIAQMKEAFERGSQQQLEVLEGRIELAKGDDETTAQLKAQLAGLTVGQDIQKLQVQEIENLVKSLNQMVVGLAIDATGKQLVLESATDFLPGSSFAERIKKSSVTPTRFATFPAADSPIKIRATEVLDSSQIPVYEKSVSAFVDEGLKALAKDSKVPIDAQVFEELKQILIGSLREGIADSSSSVSFTGGLHIMTAMHVADGTKVAALAQKLVGSIDAKKLGLDVKFNAYQHQGTTIHLGSVKIRSDANDPATMILGETVLFAIGTAPKAVYVSMGPDCEKNLKAGLDRASGKSSIPESPMSLTAEGLPIFEYVQSIVDNPAVAAMIKAAQPHSGHDMILVNSRLIPNGVVFRFTLEEGFLRAIGAAAKEGQGNRGRGF